MIDVALVTLLRSVAGVAERITPSTETNLATDTLPRIAYTQVPGGERRYTDSGASTLVQSRFQLDIYATKATAGRVIRNAICAAAPTGLDGYQGTVDGTAIKRIYFEGESFARAEKVEGQNKTIARFVQDVLIEYREPLPEPPAES